MFDLEAMSLLDLDAPGGGLVFGLVLLSLGNLPVQVLVRLNSDEERYLACLAEVVGLGEVDRDDVVEPRPRLSGVAAAVLILVLSVTKGLA